MKREGYALEMGCNARASCVRDRMSCAVLAIGPDTKSDEIDGILSKRHVSALPVVHDGRLVGIVSSTDLLRAPPNVLQRAEALMTAPVIVARPDESLDVAAWRMSAARVHRLVVTERDGARDHVVGILSARDVLEELMCRPIEQPVEAVMCTKVDVVPVGTAALEAVRRLVAARSHGLVVVDGATPVGVFGHAEALSVRAAPGGETPPRLVEQVMGEALTLHASTPVHQAAAYAVVMNALQVVLVRDEELVGVASAIDLLSVLARDPGSMTEANGPTRSVRAARIDCA